MIPLPATTALEIGDDAARRKPPLRAFGSASKDCGEPTLKPRPVRVRLAKTSLHVPADLGPYPFSWGPETIEAFERKWRSE